MYELTEEIKLDKNIKHNIDIVVDRLLHGNERKTYLFKKKAAEEQTEISGEDK